MVKPLDRNATRFATISSGAVIIALWTGFLVVAVALAGSLALASFSVAERTRQIGVRRALGASRGEIVRYFLLENLLLTAFGLGARDRAWRSGSTRCCAGSWRTWR